MQVMSEILKKASENVFNIANREIDVKSVKEISEQYNVPKSRLEYPSRFEEPEKGYNPYESSDDSRKNNNNLEGQSSGRNNGLERTENVKDMQIEKIKVDETLHNYFDDLRNKSEYSETIADEPFRASELKKLAPEETAAAREEFNEIKPELKKQWEKMTGREWPKYREDVFSENGKLIRKAGSDYDAHHVQPLGMGGKNVASNITPVHAEVHYDRQGIHAQTSPYSKLNKMLGDVL